MRLLQSFMAGWMSFNNLLKSKDSLTHTSPVEIPDGYSTRGVNCSANYLPSWGENTPAAFAFPHPN